MLCRIYSVQIQPRKRALDLTDYAAPTLQHETDPTDQESTVCLKDLDNEMELADVSDVCTISHAEQIMICLT